MGSPLTAMCKEPLCYPYLWGCSCLIGVRFTVSQVVHSKLVHSLLSPTPHLLVLASGELCVSFG